MIWCLELEASLYAFFSMIMNNLKNYVSLIRQTLKPSSSSSSKMMLILSFYGGLLLNELLLMMMSIKFTLLDMKPTQSEKGLY